MASRPSKVILIGAKGYESNQEDLCVECFSWPEIANIRNIRDYDTIVFNLLPFGNQETLSSVPWLEFLKILNFRSATEVLFNGGEIIVVGDPRFNLPIGIPREETKSPPNIPFLAWTAIDFLWDSEPGDTISFEDDYEHRQYKEYIRNLKNWKYSLAKFQQDTDRLSERIRVDGLLIRNHCVTIKIDKFCYNRYMNALAFALYYQLVKKGRSGEEILGVSGPIIFLPEVSLSNDETIQIVLRDICEIQINLPEPDWLEEYLAPGQMAVDEEIQKIEAELQTYIKRLRTAQDRREECRKCLKLLYEREQALEPIVRDILRGIGAHVEDPTEKNKEDGWIVVKVRETIFEGVLEVKSTRSDTFG